MATENRTPNSVLGLGGDGGLLGGGDGGLLGGDGGLLGGDDGLLGGGALDGLLGSGDGLILDLDGVLDPILGGGGDGLLGDLPILGDVVDLDGILGDDLAVEDLLNGEGLLGAVGSGTADEGVLEQLLSGLDVGGVGTDGLVSDLLDSPGDPGLVRDLVSPIIGDDDQNLLDDVLDLLLGENNSDPEPAGPTDPDEYDTQLIGTSGRDTFTIGEESTFVAGAGELDTAIYEGRASTEFDVDIGSDSIFLNDGEVIDYMQSVERIEFSDGTLHLDVGVGENAGIAYRLYSAALDRMPDAPGLDFWIEQVDVGVGLDRIGQGFVNSDEFRQNFGDNDSLSNEAFVEVLYENILGRDANSADQDFWVGELEDRGVSRGQVLASISESNENVMNTQDEIGSFIFIS
ncbi:DUF4214 domain-containing protein [Pararhizobium haloflavum]|uniref:DUF4214 domain-containing protein n=1 Tax=Pararhizobium haloflavum TaxID=2037914 RepID=UPI0012FFF2F5|nr:DUF4214 domain-containing protein [Pararhizobium haloflavum]